jgi:hypothetical protein
MILYGSDESKTRMSCAYHPEETGTSTHSRYQSSPWAGEVALGDHASATMREPTCHDERHLKGASLWFYTRLYEMIDRQRHAWMMPYRVFRHEEDLDRVLPAKCNQVTRGRRRHSIYV